MGTKTLKEIAKLAGVSRTTVSRVINNHPSVRTEVRERVWRIVRQVGYEPHAAARSLVTKRSNAIGLVIPQELTVHFSDPFFPLLTRGIADACNARGCQLVLSLFARSGDQDALYRQVVRSGTVDGIIVASTVVGDPLVPRLQHDGIPFVVVGREPDERVSFVDTDNAAGSRAAVEHLLRLGHRRIGTITGPVQLPLGGDRLHGYRLALAAYGIRPEPQWIATGDFGESSGHEAMLRLLPQRLTAVFAASDMMAVGAMRAIREAGLRVPDDLAVVGYDDLPIAAMVDPPLTTIHQPILKMGMVATETLLDLVEEPSRPPRRIVLPTELVIRRSCGAG